MQLFHPSARAPRYLGEKKIQVLILSVFSLCLLFKNVVLNERIVEILKDIEKYVETKYIFLIIWALKSASRRT